MNIFSNSDTNINNRLEKILEVKKFDIMTKNLLLSMLYKIENGYKDYEKIKTISNSKEEFIEKIFYIISLYCKYIKTVTPQTPDSQELETKGLLCIIDRETEKVTTFANEYYLLYALFQMDYICSFKAKTNNKNPLLREIISNFEMIAYSLDKSEVIRDFDGWSWNNNIKNIKNIEYNSIYQTMLMAFGEQKAKKILDLDDTVLKNLDENEKRLVDYAFTLIQTEIAIKDEKIKQELIQCREKYFAELELMKNKSKFLDYITEQKKQINKEIKKIDELLIDKEMLKREYLEINSKLANKDKIFSITHFENKLKEDRKEKLTQLKLKNKQLEPVEYITQKEKLEKEYANLCLVIDNISNDESKKKNFINMQKAFLDKFEKRIEQVKTKEEAIKLIYDFRYYLLIPIDENKTIYDIDEIQEKIKKTINNIIDVAIYNQAIVNISDSVSICYATLKYIFTSKIIDLNEISIKVCKKTENEIIISIYDSREAEKIYTEEINNIKDLNIKLNKRIKIFL